MANVHTLKSKMSFVRKVSRRLGASIDTLVRPLMHSSLLTTSHSNASAMSSPFHTKSYILLSTTVSHQQQKCLYRMQIASIKGVSLPFNHLNHFDLLRHLSTSHLQEHNRVLGGLQEKSYNQPLPTVQGIFQHYFLLQGKGHRQIPRALHYSSSNQTFPPRQGTFQQEHFFLWTLQSKIHPQVLLPVRHYSSSRGRETVEKRLLHLMDMWEVEDAVSLLRQSVEDGVVPNANVVLNLQQQLANLGEVESLLELHDFLKEYKLTSDARFFHCLQEAYYNSGRISEGVAVLRLLYHRTRVFADVEVYFTLLTVMVLRHFPDRLPLILQFVTDLKDAEVPVLEPEASLWKCYMMMGKWSEADHLLLTNEELRPLLHRQVSRICQGVDMVKMGEMEEDGEVVVLSRLMDLPFLRQKLKVLVAETLLAQLVKERRWQKLLKTLEKLKTAGLPLHSDKVSPVLEELQRYLTPQYDQQIEELKVWCHSLQGNTQE